MKTQGAMGMRAIVLDTETTGTDSFHDRVVEIAVADYESGQILLATLVDPGVPIPPEATQSHGLTDADVAGQPTFESFSGRLAGIIGTASAVIGYNPFFDRAFVAQELRRAGTGVKWPTLICAKRLWDKYEPKPRRRLEDAHGRFVGGEFDPHRATADVQATIRVVRAQIEEFGLQDVPWEDFDPEQAIWVGPSGHLQERDGEIVVSFGKHQWKRVQDVPWGYWKWLLNQDFPTHVLQLAWQIVNTRKTDSQIRSWIEEHLR